MSDKTGLWLWKVKTSYGNHRWVITTKHVQPRNTNRNEAIRCGIYGDYSTREQALNAAKIRQRMIAQTTPRR